MVYKLPLSFAGAGEVVSGFGGISYMQDMTSNVCNEARYGEEGQLIDTRDQKTYWVAKLEDGRCWMTQNLDLELNQADILKPTDSDISSNWPSSAISSALWKGNNNDYNEVKYYDPADGGAPTYCTNGICEQSGNPTTSSNGGHDMQGNYYSWGAATAGQATSITNGQATQSICPKGWRLPTGGSGEFYKAFNGIASTTIINMPYYFVYGGLVNNRSLDRAGSWGWYWSSTAYDADRAYYLRFDTSVYPSSNDSRYLGYSVRCVAR